MYCSWIGKICIFVTMINSQDKILQKTERMIYFHIMFMSASSIKRKSTLLLREATRSFIFRSATTFPGRKHLRENAFLGFRFEMLIRKCVFCKTFLHKIAKTFCRSLQLHFVGNCKPGWQSWYLPAI